MVLQKVIPDIDIIAGEIYVEMFILFLSLCSVLVVSITGSYHVCF